MFVFVCDPSAIISGEGLPVCFGVASFRPGRLPWQVGAVATEAVHACVHFGRTELTHKSPKSHESWRLASVQW